VSNIRATRAGVSRKRKSDALKQLEERGLVLVERSGKGRSPRAALLMLL
jgi:DNA-binding MarR family transcriptional regulator